MAIFVAQTAFSTTWGEEAQISDITITSDATYGNEDPVYDKSTWHIDVSRDIHITDTQKNTHSLSFDGANGAITDTAIEAGNITVDALKYFSIKNVAIEGFCTGAGMHVPHSRAKITLTNIGSTADADAIVISGNSIHADDDNVLGGAMYGEYIEIMNTTGNIKVSNNAVSSNGEGCAVNSGGIVGEQLISIHDNDDIYFSGNSAIGHGNTCGGAICALAPSGTSLNIEKNGDVVFSGNSVSGNNFTVGGAIGALSDVIIKGNNSISFTENKGVYSNVIYGGAIFSLVGVQISENKAADSTAVSVDFSGNSLSGVSSAFGGAISATIDSTEGLIETQSTGHDVKLENNGNINFSDNSIETVGRGRGGAIYADNSVKLTGNAAVVFDGNTITAININDSADYIPIAEGGAIYGTDSVLIFDNSSLTFSNNSVTSGEVDADGNIINTRAGNVGGAAIYSKGDVILGYVDEDGTKHGNGILTLTGNKSAVYENDSYQLYDDICGGAIYAEKELTISGNTSVNISSNSISSIENTARGGAIYSKENVNICNNGAVAFNSNIAISTHDKGYGGAICSEGYILMDNNASLTFDNNSIHANSYDGTYGGAIYSAKGITFSNNGDIKFSNNKIATDASGVISYGTRGAAISSDGSIYIGDENGGNNNVSFIGNEIINEGSGPVKGGAIGNRGSVSLSYNNEVTFENNKVQNKSEYGSEVSGGAISAEGSIYIESNNGKVVFKNNVAQSGGDIGSTGGAIVTGSVMMINNGQGVYFEGNKALAVDNYTMGGAIACSGGVTLGLNNGVSFSNNVAINYGTLEPDENSGVLSWGGAIMSLAGGVLATYNTGDINFSYNGVAAGGASSFAWGGAIVTQSLSIGNNSGNVTFAGNFESGYIIHSIADVANGTIGEHKTILRSLCVTDGEFMLAANKDTSITFYDSIYVAASENYSTVVFNFYPDYLSEEGSYIASSGNIVFSGARTEKDLAKVEEYLKSQNFDAAAGDIEASRTSAIERDVIVAAGSLQVIDGAKLRLHDGTKGYALILVDGAEMGPQVGVEYTPELSAKLVVSAGSRIEAGSITFDSNTEFTVTGASSSIAYAATFSVREAALVAELQADTVTLTGGMTYTQEGAYTLMVGDSNKLIIDVSNGLAFTLNLDASVAYTEGEMTYFVLFTDVEMLNLEGTDSLENVGVNYNLGGNYTDPTMGYDKATGTLYVSAKSSTIPEPTTATLSLLALAALAARRRRR